MDAVDGMCSEEIGRELREAGFTIACAESCTGGLLTSTLTDIPGSSAYLMGSVVSYSNDVKSRVLGVSEETLSRYGAVSEETARAMAEGVRRLMQTDIGVGITGIAGPDGGSEEKPVGLVYIAIADQTHTIVEKNNFSGTRLENKRAAVEKALHMIHNVIRSSL
jgi:competence/damage-inducible protein CinA C-terminal domain